MSSDQRTTSPRSNVRRVLEESGAVHGGDDVALREALALLSTADAENKRKNRKLYLLLDLDETLIVAKNLEKEPSHVPVGKPIVVQGRSTLRFDLIERPGLQHFLREVSKLFVVFMYTMGDEAYVRAVLDVIDPHGKNFAGGIACWKESEGRHHKYIERVVCDRSMALVVDDMMDYWTEDMPNFILTRRFVGDQADDGLMLLYGQLKAVHEAYFKAAAAAATDEPPAVPRVLAEMRGAVFGGCTIAFTGVVLDQTEETLVSQPLCKLVRLFGGDVTLDVDRATHLVARQKEGWRGAAKIRKAIARMAQDPSFVCVWDHWLWDSLAAWKAQPTDDYALPTSDADEAPAVAAASALPPSVTQRDDSPPAARSEPSDAAGRKRPREAASDNSEPAVYRSMGAVSAYLKGKQASSGAGE